MPIDYMETEVYMKDHPVYYLEDEEGSLSTVDKMFEAMEDAVKRYGIKFLVFDHLHFLVRSLTHTNAEIGIITRRQVVCEKKWCYCLSDCSTKKVKWSKANGRRFER